MHRDYTIDYEKGIVVALMVFCHVMQFFGNEALYPEQYWITQSICVLAFPLFLFTFGRSVYIAYYTKPFFTVVPRMLKSALRCYCSFCISGIFCQVFINNAPFNLSTIWDILVLNTIPSMSEFLISFALFAVLALVAFPIFKWLLSHKTVFWCVTLLCGCSVFIPYNNITDPRLGLLIGTTAFSAFPLLQYMPFFLLGMYVAAHSMQRKWIWLLVSGVLTAIAVGHILAYHLLPTRFPPSLMWLLLSIFGVIALDIFSSMLEKWVKISNPLKTVLPPHTIFGQ